MITKGKIIFEGESKKGKKFIVRYPAQNDVDDLLGYINRLSKEKTFIRFQGEEITLDEEKKFLADQLEKIERQTAILLLLYVENELAGVAGVEMQDRIHKHIGSVGISLALHHRGEGLGTVFIENLIKEAKNALPDLQILQLSLFANNKAAHNLYKKFGFIEYGLLPNGILYKGSRVDHVYMYREIK